MGNEAQRTKQLQTMRNRKIKFIILENNLKKYERGEINTIRYLYLTMAVLRLKLYRMAEFYEEDNRR